MPVEIRELTVKVSVNPAPDDGVKSGPSNPALASAEVQARWYREALIQECIIRVLQVLNEREER
jgi:hypothetical protein